VAKARSSSLVHLQEGKGLHAGRKKSDLNQEEASPDGSRVGDLPGLRKGGGESEASSLKGKGKKRKDGSPGFVVCEKRGENGQLPSRKKRGGGRTISRQKHHAFSPTCRQKGK